LNEVSTYEDEVRRYKNRHNNRGGKNSPSDLDLSPREVSTNKQGGRGKLQKDRYKKPGNNAPNNTGALKNRRKTSPNLNAPT
jgi:hypothetical protein